jgi:hypothetical protein
VRTLTPSWREQFIDPICGAVFDARHDISEVLEGMMPRASQVVD